MKLGMLEFILSGASDFRRTVAKNGSVQETLMIQARANQGQLEVQDPIPAAWEGQFVKLVPLTPDDLPPDLDQQIATLHARGAMEFEPGEREVMTAALQEMNRLSKT